MALLKSQLKEAQSEQSQRCQEMAKLRAQLKECQESAHNARHRLEQQQDRATMMAMTQQVNNKSSLDNRRSITSPILSSRQLFASDSDHHHQPNGSDNDIQRLQRKLIDQHQSIDAERQVWQTGQKKKFKDFCGDVIYLHFFDDLKTGVA